MKMIMAFGASNSQNSINKAFARYAASRVVDADVNLIDLNDFVMPIYSIDIEKETGIPEAALKFKEIINGTDAIVISFAEHNGHYTVAFKNIFDWVSRMDRNIWLSKPMLLLSTAPGPGGASRVLESAVVDMSRKNGKIVGSFSLPSYRENFSPEFGILNAKLQKAFNDLLDKFNESIQAAPNPINT
jgi:NAD(P)H-dependent FMN reductase